MKESKSSQITILAIDNEIGVLDEIASVVEGAGYGFHRARDAKSAREALRQATPGLIISDINLVGQSGLAVCEQLKRETGNVGVPLLFLSSAQVPDIIRRSHSAGAAYYLRKPFQAAVLLELVEKACSKSQPRPSMLSRGATMIDQRKPIESRPLGQRATGLAVK